MYFWERLLIWKVIEAILKILLQFLNQKQTPKNVGALRKLLSFIGYYRNLYKTYYKTFV